MLEPFQNVPGCPITSTLFFSPKPSISDEIDSKYQRRWSTPNHEVVLRRLWEHRSAASTNQHKTRNSHIKHVYHHSAQPSPGMTASHLRFDSSVVGRLTTTRYAMAKWSMSRWMGNFRSRLKKVCHEALHLHRSRKTTALLSKKKSKQDSNCNSIDLSVWSKRGVQKRSMLSYKLHLPFWASTVKGLRANETTSSCMS